jgi:hypothetical protein
MIDRLRALRLLAECTGRDIWSLEYCRERRVPEAWLVELKDCFESGFETDRQTIYHLGEVVNQFEGVRDLDLAYKLAAAVGVDVKRATYSALGATAEVAALKEAVDE